ncbi:hypothetical protein PAXINDRAFT_16705 [Paxillus involutus ATCC 200175]|uniref:Uncharacterized protein n=1 Tax=Paxillus involutus ATCC 200175 TaxID=664439 RepID=A0A0C9TSU2_PAXIN|nr:hypothetical protein PAXINDRAFT_16705 [Paxillus involutus ATCC 200175]
MRSAGPAVPVGMMNKPLNGIDNGVEGGNGREVDEDVKVEGKTGEWASGIENPSSNDNGGDEDVRHAYVVPNLTQLPPYHILPTPDERPPPPSTLLEGERSGKQSSGHIDKTGMHLEVPRHKSTTTQPEQVPEAAGARDEARDDEEGQDIEEMLHEEEEG